MNKELAPAQLKLLLAAWRNLDESVGENEEDALAEALVAWAAGKAELDEEAVYYGIDFMSSRFYKSGDAAGAIHRFLEQAAASGLSIRVECLSRGYLLTLYGDLSEVPELSRLVLEQNSGGAWNCLGALEKAVLLGIPGIAEALEPLLSSSAWDPIDREDLRSLVSSIEREKRGVVAEKPPISGKRS